MPAVYLLYVVLTALQPVLFVLVGALQHVSTRGVAFMLVLLVGLGYGSRMVWGLLLVLNAILLLAIGAAIGGHTLWANVAAMVLTGIALEAVLLSSAMREHVLGRRHAARLAC